MFGLDFRACAMDPAKSKSQRNEQYGEVRWAVVLTNQNDEPVATYELLTMNAV